MVSLLQYFFNRRNSTFFEAHIAIDMDNLPLCAWHIVILLLSMTAQFKNTPTPLCEERGCCFSYTGTASGDNQCLHHISGAPSRSTRAMISTASSITGSVCVAISVVRSKHSPSTHAGAITGLTYTPSSNIFLPK